MKKIFLSTASCCLLLPFCLFAFQPLPQKAKTGAAVNHPNAVLIPSEKFIFNSFVDCNMATAWVADTFRIFPGKYGEDPLWGEAHELKYASGKTVDEVFSKKPEEFHEPIMPSNAPAGKAGLHGAVWFEALYKYTKDVSGKTLFAVYHNENYPSTLPYDSVTGEGYKDENWPQGLKGDSTKTAVCRIGIMKSTDGGRSWQNKGIILEDHQPRLILRPHNTGINFAGGVGDPSAVANGDYLYIFYGEYGYPSTYTAGNYDPAFEWTGQCVSMARIALADLDNPAGKARRWNGQAFAALPTQPGKPVSALQIPLSAGGGPASSPVSKYFWGPSVSWNNYLHAWVMLIAKAEGPSWKGSSIYISFNTNEDLGKGSNSQQWSKPLQLVNKPGHIVWYPSLQPVNSANDQAEKYTSVNLGSKARLFYKDMYDDKSEYVSEYLVEFSNKR